MDSLRGRVYLSKQRIKRQVRGGLVIVSEIRETLRLFTRRNGMCFTKRAI